MNFLVKCKWCYGAMMEKSSKRFPEHLSSTSLLKITSFLKNHPLSLLSFEKYFLSIYSLSVKKHFFVRFLKSVMYLAGFNLMVSYLFSVNSASLISDHCLIIIRELFHLWLLVMVDWFPFIYLILCHWMYFSSFVPNSKKIEYLLVRVSI